MTEKVAEAVRLLVVSKEPTVLNLLSSIGEVNSWRLETADSAWEGLERLQSGATPDLLLLDLPHGDGDGLYVLRWLRRVRPDLPAILLGWSDDEKQVKQAFRLGAQDYLVRPFEQEQLELIIRRQLVSRSERVETEIASADVEQVGDGVLFVAASPIMRKLRAQAELLAQADVPVLLVGESGSGTEIVAHLIHKLSVRSDFAFLNVNCAALSEDPLKHEFLGEELNGFTAGALNEPSKIKRCHKGTIFFDEIAELPSGLQDKLLHIIQEKNFSRLGSQTKVETDIQVVAATGVNIQGAGGKLRQDLYHQLSAFCLHVPSLRQRKEDIPLLLTTVMNNVARHHGLEAKAFSPAVLHACQSYWWPGNLRELESFVRRYLVLQDEQLALRELERRSGHWHAGTASTPVHFGVEPSFELCSDGTFGLKLLVENVKGEAERNAIADALVQTHWNRKAAARLLKVSYRTLLYKIQRYHMIPPESYAPFLANGAKSN